MDALYIVLGLPILLGALYVASSPRPRSMRVQHTHRHYTEPAKQRRSRKAPARSSRSRRR